MILMNVGGSKMANNRCVYQQQTNVSIPRQALIEIASNQELDEDDLRVVLALFTELNGWRESENGRSVDPENFKILDKDSIADELGIKKKHVRKSIERLIDECIIEQGSSATVRHGYRFRF